MELTTNTIYNQTMPSFRIPGMTESQTAKWFCSGRQCGVALEDIIANQFDNTSGDGSTQGKSPDCFVTINGVKSKVQIKTTNLMDSKANKIKKVTSSTKIWVGESALYDSRNRRPEEEILAKSESHFSSYDYFMIVDISEMINSKYKFVLVSSEDLRAVLIEEPLRSKKTFPNGNSGKCYNVLYQSVFNENRTIIDLPFKDVE